MTKLKLENRDLEALRTTGKLSISETDAYEVVDELQTYQDFSKVKERFIVRNVQTNELLELVIVKTFRNRTDLVGHISSATTKPLTSTLKKRLTSNEESALMAPVLHDKLAQVRKELGV
ncbi:hypothetical protein AWK70_09470 [Listeria monocytogenes]|uniref:Uncharacterized protein n=1 Tax=Listeria monocytogenes TaxID=1639 RepID=A0A9P2A8F1_LISMN|nr:hypothetical protein [Listeria monocytogenes]AVV07505.1 hypothetical protein CXL08_11185 [Listeria monocytogenes]EAC2536834.1 hypothetical protein [Listeria monocytogenes]EAC3050174.1 hypothetical protein [Listeria monocytogenes]EAC4326057.1 hypothetical protein [Listeria monocytogenes]EAC5175732.1 hypothetical protein [Listeria monocytogenes]